MIPPEIEAVALLGWHIYPASNYSRAACFEGASDAATCDLDTIERWAKQYPACNWRVVAGPSGIWGVDLDTPVTHKHDGIAAFKAIIAEHEPLPLRPTMRSGGGGMAIFFRHTGEPIIGKGGHPKPGIDPRRGQQSQTIPPSRHHQTGRPYRWLVPPWEVSPPRAPAWLLELVKPTPEPDLKAPARLDSGEKARRYAIGWLYHAVRRIASAPEGDRNNALNRECYGIARNVASGALTEGEIRDAFTAAARAARLPIREACLTIESGLKSRRK